MPETVFDILKQDHDALRALVEQLASGGRGDAFAVKTELLPSDRDRRTQDQDAGSANSSAVVATEDDCAAQGILGAGTSFFSSLLAGGEILVQE